MSDSSEQDRRYASSETKTEATGNQGN